MLRREGRQRRLVQQHPRLRPAQPPAFRAPPHRPRTRPNNTPRTAAQSEKPALKHLAKGLKETLALQHQAVEAQQGRVASLAAAGAAAASSSVHAGFNVIRARLTAEGKSWPTADLRTERERLTAALNQLAIDIAAAKAEIKSQRRADEVEIWETQLVALQVRRRRRAQRAVRMLLNNTWRRAAKRWCRRAGGEVCLVQGGRREEVLLARPRRQGGVAMGCGLTCPSLALQDTMRVYRQEINIIEVELLGREQQARRRCCRGGGTKVAHMPAVPPPFLAGRPACPRLPRLRLPSSEAPLQGPVARPPEKERRRRGRAPPAPLHAMQERIEAERAAAEASGVAALQRLQDQALQTRIRFNRAKQQYHFPPPFGYK